MRQSDNELLFYSQDLGNLIQSYEAQLREEVEAWERNKVLAASESDLVTYLVDKYTLHPPRLLPDNIYIESEGEASIDVSGDPLRYVRDRSRPLYFPGSFVTIAIPFEGEPALFSYKASTYSLNPPRAHVSGSKILVSFRGTDFDGEQLRKEIDATVNRIEDSLTYTQNDCQGWNERVQSIAEECLRNRKARILKQANLVSALGLPLKRRKGASKDLAIPVTRKKRPITVPPTPAEHFEPEPTLPGAEYDYILNVINQLSLMIERSPSTFVDMNENQIRDILLVNLNGHYDGGATGETFNAHGKTDILIRADERNAFIAECKIWSGPKALLGSIDQILGYLTWRDTKAALLFFSRNADFTRVLSSIANAVCQHPNFKRELARKSETHTRFLFRQKEDPHRDLFLAVLAFICRTTGKTRRLPRKSATIAGTQCRLTEVGPVLRCRAAQCGLNHSVQIAWQAP